MSHSEDKLEDASSEFLELLSEHERSLSNYVLGMVGCPHDAKDILQDGKVVMWKNFSSFESGTSFAAWARTVLLHRVYAFRRRSKKHAHDVLDEETLLALDADTPAESEAREQRWVAREEALDGCLKALSEDQRSILQARYEEDASIVKIARKFGRTEGAVYRQLSRLRIALHHCVESALGSNPQES